MAKRRRVYKRRMRCKTPGRKIRSRGRGKGLARGRGRGPLGVPSMKFRRLPNPANLARSMLSKVAEPGSKFSLTTLKQALRRYGYRNVSSWFNEMIDDARRRRLITPVSKSVFVFTPAAANPCLFRRRRRVKRHKK